jgi:hypothetical protein
MSVTFARKATLVMLRMVLGQTASPLKLFHDADVTAGAVSDPIVQMVTSAFARFVYLSFKYNNAAL